MQVASVYTGSRVMTTQSLRDNLERQGSAILRGDTDLEANLVEMVHGSQCLELLPPEVVCMQVESISHAVLKNLF